MAVAVSDNSRIEFEVQRRAIRRVLDLGEFSTKSLELRRWEDPGIMGMVYDLRIAVLAHKFVTAHQEASTTVAVPKTWWQHLKQDHAPKWFKTRYPVQKRNIRVELEVTFERYSTFPMADIPMPENFGQPVIIENITPHWKQYDK